jgi:hypothetical protein
MPEIPGVVILAGAVSPPGARRAAALLTGCSASFVVDVDIGSLRPGHFLDENRKARHAEVIISGSCPAFLSPEYP